MPITTGKGNTGTQETHPTAHTDDGTNGPPEPHQTHGTTIYLSRSSLRARVIPGVTLGRRIADARSLTAAGEEFVTGSLTVHRGTANGIWLGRTSAAGVKSSCTQIWVPAGFRSFAAVAYPHTVSPSGSDVDSTMPHNSRSVHSLFAGSKSPY